jgi:Protein of unknown function (DUF3099)
VRFIPQARRGRVYTVTDAQRPKSEDISQRQRRYLISMGIRIALLPLVVFLFHGIWLFVAAGVVLLVPAFAVIYANGGREPNNAAEFDSSDPRRLPDRRDPSPGAGQGPRAEQADSESRVAADPRSSTPGNPAPN